MTASARVLIASDRARPPGDAALLRAFERAGHVVVTARLREAVDRVDDDVEAVVVRGSREAAHAVARRLKTRFQVPLLPVVALVSRPGTPPDHPAPDVWLAAATRPGAVVERVEELIRIRRAERELVRLNGALAELAADNGRLYDRARRDAEATTLLLRELQHRVRNNLAAIQALLVLERHRTPPRPLVEALDVAIARLRSMAALQDALLPHPQMTTVDLAILARAVTRSALDVFSSADDVVCEVVGNATLPSRIGSPLAIVLNELITNVLKHAAATRVCVEIHELAGAIELSVSDDGRGVPGGGEPASGSGLMIARAVVRNELAGTMAFLPVERGTRVRITLPPPGAISDCAVAPSGA